MPYNTSAQLKHTFKAMKKTFLLSALLFPLGAFAQEPVVTIIQSTDSLTLYDVLHKNAPHFMNIPDVPRFTLLGKDHQFYLGIGANVKAIGVYDMGNPVESPNSFITSNIPMYVAPGNGAKFSLSAQQSNFYFNVVALPGTKNQLGAYIDINFMANGYAPKLSHAYLKYRDITAGYTFSIYSDAGAAPTTIDFQGVDAYTGAKMGMVAYEPRFGKNKEWGLGIGLDMPNNSFTLSSETFNVNQRVPNIPFYVQRSWADGKGWLRLSGLIRNLYYRDESNPLDAKNVDKIGWGIKASGKSPIYGGLTALYLANYGKGIASYIQDLGGTGMDLMPVPNKPGELSPVKVWSGYGGLQYDFNERVSSTVAYGHVRTYASAVPDGWDKGYRYGQYVVANVFWNVNSIVQVGAEYLYGRRVNYGGAQAHDNRAELQLQVSF